MTYGIFLALLSLLLYGIWGFSFKMLSAQAISAEWGVAMAMIVGGVASAAIAVAKGHSMPAVSSPQTIWIILAIAASGTLGNVILLRSMATPGLPAGVPLAIGAAYPLVATLLAWVFLAESIGARQLLGMLLVVAGVIAISI